MELQQSSPISQEGGASDGIIDQPGQQQQPWTNESSGEPELIANNGLQHYYEPQPKQYLPNLKHTDNLFHHHHHHHHHHRGPIEHTTINDERENGPLDTSAAAHNHHHEPPSEVTEISVDARFAEPNLVTATFDNGNSVFEYYPNEPNNGGGSANCYRTYVPHYAHHPLPHHSPPAGGYARYGDYYGQRHYFEHREIHRREDHYGQLARAEEGKADGQPAGTATSNYYSTDADTIAEVRLFDPNTETSSSLFEDVTAEDYGHNQGSCPSDDNIDQPGQQQQQWTNESSSEPELLTINGRRYYNPQQMQYMPANDKQQPTYVHHHHHHHHRRHHHDAVTETSVFVEPNLMTASFASASKYNAGGSLVEYYPSETNYNENNCYRPYVHRTHPSQQTDSYPRFVPGADYYQQTNGTAAAGGRHYFEQEEVKTYHLLKQGSQQYLNQYARTKDDETNEQPASMTELQSTASTTKATNYYGTDTDTIPEVPRVSRLYDPNTEINSSLFDDVPTEDYSNEQVEEVEEEGEDEEVEEVEEDEDSLMSSSGSTSTGLAKTTNNCARQRSRVVTAATTIHHTASQAKLARCAPETIERLKLFLQRRQQLRGQSLHPSSTSYRTCCASTSQATAAIRAQSNRQAVVEKNGPLRGGVKGGQLEESSAPISNLQSNLSQADRPSIGGAGHCAYSRCPSTSDQTNHKANSLSSSPSSCNESTYDESSNPTSRASTITNFHHHPATTATTTTTIMTENRQLRNRTIVITSSSSYSKNQANDDSGTNRDLKRHASSYGLETRSSKRRQRQSSQDVFA